MRKRALLPSLSNLAVYPRLTARKVPLSASTAFPILVLQVTHFTIIRSSRNFPQLPSGVCQATKALPIKHLLKHAQVPGCAVIADRGASPEASRGIMPTFSRC